jgi:MFS family permease
MIAPAFFTGHLIKRYGVLNIMLAGGFLGIACVVVNLTGSSVAHFWAALLLLGISWNFLFIGATTLLTETYRPEERAKTQALNDFVVFTTVALSSLSAGALQNSYGWQVVNLGLIPLLVVILASIIWGKSRYNTATVS